MDDQYWVRILSQKQRKNVKQVNSIYLSFIFLILINFFLIANLLLKSKRLKLNEETPPKTASVGRRSSLRISAQKKTVHIDGKLLMILIYLPRINFNFYFR